MQDLASKRRAASQGEHYHDPANVEFRRLKEVCGWTGATIARRLDITPGVISQYIHGRTRPSTLALKALQRAIADEAAGPSGSALQGTIVSMRVPARRDREPMVRVLTRIKAKAKALMEAVQAAEDLVAGKALPRTQRK